jgi:hypothetical protein
MSKAEPIPSSKKAVKVTKNLQWEIDVPTEGRGGVVRINSVDNQPSLARVSFVVDDRQLASGLVFIENLLSAATRVRLLRRKSQK